MGDRVDKKAATIYDIAKRVGLSAATVSRVINNKGYISEETRRLVMDASRELQYTPNQIARSLKDQKTRQIVLSIPYVKEVFNFDLIAAVQSVVIENDYSLLLSYTQASEKEEAKVLDSLFRNYADGLILTTTNISERLAEKISGVHQPVVVSCFSNNRITGDKRVYDYVGVDAEKGVYISTGHLIRQGHVKIGYMGPPLKNQLGDDRYSGYCLAMNEAGLRIDPGLVRTGGHSELFGYEAGMAMADSGGLPTAICASTDLIVLGVYKAFEQKGIKIPEDVCVVGMDNIDICTLVKPKISSVAISQEEIGRAAAEIIFERINGSTAPKKSMIFQPRLVVRESSIQVKLQ